MRPVVNKQDWLRRWLAGEFGNRLRVWETPIDLLLDDYQGEVGLRVLRPGYAGSAPYPQPIEVVLERYAELLRAGVRANELLISEGPENKHTTLNAEVMRGLYGLELTFSTERTYMRAAMRRPRYARGLEALCILRQALNEASWADVEQLLDHYPDHVIELTACEVLVGNVPGRNTIIWEVRRY